MEKVNQQVRKEIGIIIQQELSDPRLEFVSITRVDVSRDLRSAKVFFSVLGEADKVTQAQKSLNSAGGVIRRMVGQKIKMRFTPEFFFYYDNSLDMSNKIEETLKEIQDETSDDY